MGDIRQYLKECDEDLKGYFSDKHVKTIKSMFIQGTTRADLQRFFNTNHLQNANATRYVFEMLQDVKKWKKTISPEQIIRFQRLVEHWSLQRKRVLMAECFETINKYEPETEALNTVWESKREMIPQPLNTVNVVMLLKLSQHAPIPMNPIHLMKQGGRVEQHKDSIVKRFKLCQFETQLRPKQEIKFSVEGAKNGEIWLSNTSESNPTEQGTMFITRVYFKYHKLNLFKTAMFVEMNQVEEFLALSLLLPPSKIHELHHSQERYRRELQLQAENFEETKELRSLLFTIESPLSLRNFYYSIAWLQPNTYLEMNNEGIDSKMFRFFANNLPRQGHHVEQEYRAYDVAVLKLTIKTAYYSERREYHTDRLSQAVGALLKIDPECISFFARLMEDQFTKNPAMLMPSTLPYKDIEPLIFDPKNSALKCLTHYVLLFYYNRHRKLDVAAYIAILAKLQQILKEKRPAENHSLAIKYTKILSTINEYSYQSDHFRIGNIKDFMGLWSGLCHLPAELQRVFIKPTLTEKLRKQMKDEITRRSFSSVNLISSVLIQYRCTHIFDVNELEREVLEDFFMSESYSYRSNMFGSTTRMVSKYQAFIPITILQNFVSEVYQPIVCNPSIAKLAPLSNQLNEALVQHPFKEICGILSNAVNEESLRANYEHFRYMVTSLYDREVKSYRMRYREVIGNGGWLFMLSLAKWLSDILMDLFLHGVKAADRERPGLVQNLLDFLYECDNTRIPEVIRDHLMLRLFDADNIRQVTPDDIRNTLFNNPAQAKIYCRLAITTSINASARETLSNSVNEVKDQIEQEKISYKRVKQLQHYSEDTWKYMQQLFRYCDGTKLRVIIQGLHHKCEEFLEKVAKYEALFGKFQQLYSLTAPRQACRQVLYKFKQAPYLSFKIQGVDLSRLDKQLLECYELRSFQSVLKISDHLSFVQFVDALNSAMGLLRQRLAKYFLQLQDKTLTLEDVSEMFRGLSIYDIAEVMKIHKGATPEDIRTIQLIYTNYTNVPLTSQLHKGLLNLCIRYDDVECVDTLATLSNTYQKISTDSLKEVNALQFNSQFLAFSELLQSLQFKMDRKDEPNKVIGMLSDCQQVWAMMERVKKEDIDELKEYINEQEEGFVNSRNVIQLQCVHRFYNGVLKSNTTLKGFTRALIEFINEQTKRGGESLAGSLESCELHRATLQQKLSEVKHRQASFKFNVLDVMKSCTVTITHNNESDEKEMKMQQNDLRSSQQRVFTQRQLAQFRDKSLLIINSLKRNKQEDFGFLDEEIRTLRLFVELYERLEKILELYARLLSMGYPNSFITEQAQKNFNIDNAEFGNVVSYLERLEDHERKWELEIKHVYQESYGFCHFQGRQLKHLINSLTELKLDPSLSKIIPMVNDTFPLFLETDEAKNILPRLKIVKDPLTQLEFAKEFFKYFDIRPADSRSDRKILAEPQPVIVRMSVCEEHKLYEAVLATIGPNRNLSQLLFCKNGTTKYEVETFLLRSLLDSSNKCYIVVEASKLPSRTQLHFEELLEEYIRSDKLAPKLRRNRLLLLDCRSNNQRLYSFLQNHKKFQLIREDLDHARLQQNFVDNNLNVKLVHSKRAGYGKTFWIDRHARQNKKGELLYLPLCGFLDINRVVERLKALMTQKKQDRQSIVIQLHGVKNKHVLDELLLQLLFFRAVYHEGFHYLPQNLTLYVEIQNITGEMQLRQYRSLSLFTDSQAIVNLKQPVAEAVQLNPSCRSHMFVLQYLQMLRDGTIDIVELPFASFSEVNISFTAEQIPSLLQEFFFQPMQRYEPSFVQFLSFMQLLFEAFKVFGQCFYYSVQLMNDYHIEFKEAGFDRYRSSYLKLLIDNARCFLLRTVNQSDIAELMATGVFHDKLEKFPFLILSNSDETTYSFVYTDHNDVPQIIKKYILIQDGLLRGNNINNQTYIDNMFSRSSLSHLKEEQLAAQMFKMLTEIAGVGEYQLVPSDDYSLTLDNFFKMCLIVQRIKSKVPVVIMGETGVGKTALIRFLAKNVYRDELLCLNVNAGTNEKVLAAKFEEIKRTSKVLEEFGKRLWVFFDEFNTTDDVGYISELIMEHRFLGEPLNCNNVVFLAACNPFRNIRANERRRPILGYERRTSHIGNLLYRVLPPPESTLEVMWNFEELKPRETELYIRAILHRIEYRREKVVQVLIQIHAMIQNQVQKSAANLRDVFRFKTLFNWFMENMPFEAIEQHRRTVRNVDFDFNYSEEMPREQRAFILTVCFCYYLRLSDFELRRNCLAMVEAEMGYFQGYMNNVMENEQTDYLCRMNRPVGIATNLALRENVFSCFVCLMNRLPIIIVGMPGCSKSLSVKLLLSNLRGTSSEEDYFKGLPGVQMFYFQGSESCTSEGVEQVFQRAHRIERNIELEKKSTKSIACILFEEIGLAEVSVHNPLKVLHAHLQTQNNQLAFIGISNWELDAAKMSRFLVINRPLPDDEDLKDTADKIFESYDPTFPDKFSTYVQALSMAYSEFIKTWKQMAHHRDFFGMRDFYALIKDICCNIKQREVKYNDRNLLLAIVKRAVAKNFDGRPQSIVTFMKILSKYQPAFNSIPEEQEPIDPLEQIHKSLAQTESRCLLEIINDESVVFLVNHKLTKQNQQRYVITIHGSTFKQDEHSEQYNLYVISDVINYVSRGDLLVFKDVNNNIQTSLYDLFNKSFHRVGNRNFCRVSVGANYNPKCFVHPSFNCLVYVNEDKLAEVDPPFLNRFEKHCLNIGGLLTEEEASLIRQLESWIDRMLYKVFVGERQLLKRENFIVNCSRQALASLAIKCIMEHADHFTQVEEAKKILLMNSTGDFELLVETDLIDKGQVEFARKCINEKYQRNLMECPLLIVTTYDQRVQITSDNLLSKGPRTKTLRICQMNCQKDLRNELEEFFQSPIFETLQVKLNLSSEGKHLCMLIFLIDKTMKKFPHSMDTKRVHIVLATSRLEVVEDGLSREISYLNGYQQVFLDTLQVEQINLLCSPKNIDRLLIERPHIVDVKSKLSNIFYRAISRFEFTYETPNEITANRPLFWKMLQSLPQNENFVRRSTQFMQRLLTQMQIENWKQEVLMHRRLAMLAHSSFEAVDMYFLAQFEDTLNAFVRLIVELDVIYQLNLQDSLVIACYYSPDSKAYLASLLSKAEKSKKVFIDALADSILGGQNELLTSKAPRQLGSQKIILKQPRLFPTLTRAFPVLFGASETDESILNICRQFKNQKPPSLDLTCTMSMAQITREQVELRVSGLLLNHPLFATKIGQSPLLSALDTEQFFWGRELLLYEIANEYLQTVLKVSSSKLIKFLEIFNKFMPMQSTLLQRIIGLIIPERLWKATVFLLVNLADCGLFHEDSPAMHYLQTTEDSTEVREVALTRLIIERCEEGLRFDQQQMQQAGGYQRFLTQYDKFYNCIELVSPADVALSRMGRLQHELMQMWRDVEFEKAVQLLEGKLLLQNDSKEIGFKSMNILSRALVGLLPQERVDTFRGKLLCQAYLQQKPGSLDERLLIDILEETNRSKIFSAQSQHIIRQTIQHVQIEFDCSQTFDQLDERYLSRPLAVVNKMLNNNMHTTVATVISEHFSEGLRRWLVQTNDDPKLQLAELLKSFDQGLQPLSEDKANPLQCLFLAIYGKHTMECYAAYLELTGDDMEAQPLPLEELERILNQKMVLLESLRIYFIKLLVKRLSFPEFIRRYISINRLPWVSRYSPQLPIRQNALGVRYEVEPSEQVRQKLAQFADSRFNGIDLLEEAVSLVPQSYQDRLAFLTFFRNNASNIISNQDATAKINDLLVRKQRETPNIALEAQLVKKIITTTLFTQTDDKQEKLVNEIILSNFCWLMATRHAHNPLTNVFFEEGWFVQRVADKLHGNYLPGGPDCFLIVENRKVLELQPRSHNMLTCRSRRCSYAYSDLEPEPQLRCPVCNDTLTQMTVISTGVLKPKNLPALDEKYNQACRRTINNRVQDECYRNPRFFSELMGWPLSEIKSKPRRLLPLTQAAIEIAVESAFLMTIRLGWISPSDCSQLWNRSPLEVDEILYRSLSKNVLKLQLYCANPESISRHFVTLYQTSFSFQERFLADLQNERQKLHLSIRELSDMAKTVNPKDGNVINNLIKENEKAVKDLEQKAESQENSAFRRNQFELILQTALYTIRDVPDDVSRCPEDSLERMVRSDAFDLRRVPFMRVLQSGHRLNVKQSILKNELVLKQGHPITFMVLYDRSKLDTLLALYETLHFLNWVQDTVNCRLSRAITSKLKLNEFLRQQVSFDNEKRLKQEKEAINCVENLNRLTGSEGWQMSSPLDNFLLHPENETLKELYSRFSKLQHYLLLHCEEYFTGKKKALQIPVQSVEEGDLAFLTREQVEKLIANSPSDEVNWASIESAIINILRQKPRFDGKLLFIEYAGDAKMESTKYYDYLNSLRIGSSEPSEEVLKLKEKMLRLQEARPSQFYYFAKMMQDTLERILVNLHSLPDAGLTVGDYNKKHTIKGTSNEALEFLKDVRIEDTFKAYETIETLVYKKNWEMLDEKYKAEMEQIIKQQMRDVFKQLNRRQLANELPDFEMFCVALNRLVARCLVQAQVPQGTSLEELLRNRPDVWPWEFPKDRIEALAKLLIGVQLMHIFALYELTKEFNPARQPVPARIQTILKPAIDVDKQTVRRVKRPKEIIRE